MRWKIKTGENNWASYKVNKWEFRSVREGETWRVTSSEDITHQATLAKAKTVAFVDVSVCKNPNEIILPLFRLCYPCCERVTALGRCSARWAASSTSPRFWWPWSARCVSRCDTAGSAWTRTRFLSSCTQSSARSPPPCATSQPTRTSSVRRSSTRSWPTRSGKDRLFRKEDVLFCGHNTLNSRVDHSLSEKHPDSWSWVKLRLLNVLWLFVWVWLSSCLLLTTARRPPGCWAVSQTLRSWAPQVCSPLTLSLSRGSWRTRPSLEAVQETVSALRSSTAASSSSICTRWPQILLTGQQSKDPTVQLC